MDPSKHGLRSSIQIRSESPGKRLPKEFTRFHTNRVAKLKAKLKARRSVCLRSKGSARDSRTATGEARGGRDGIGLRAEHRGRTLLGLRPTTLSRIVPPHLCVPLFQPHTPVGPNGRLANRAQAWQRRTVTIEFHGRGQGNAQLGCVLCRCQEIPRISAPTYCCAIRPR